jgi:hypothetical protein
MAALNNEVLLSLKIHECLRYNPGKGLKGNEEPADKREARRLTIG